MLETFFEYLLAITSDLGYGGVFFLMTVESSFIPFPSELVVPPAAYLAQQGEFNIYLVVLFAVLGSMAGAVINYFLAMKLGRVVVFKMVDSRFAKYLLLSRTKIEKAETFFLKYGGLATFIGRLLPGIRQLISLPAGFSRMNFKAFLFYTFLGAGIWCVILALQGYLIGEYKEFFSLYLTEIIVGTVVFVAVGVLVLKLWGRWRKRK